MMLKDNDIFEAWDRKTEQPPKTETQGAKTTCLVLRELKNLSLLELGDMQITNS